MQDAGSTNGTTVNGNTVPRQGHGPAVELNPGDDVRLGQVELTFLDSEALVAFASRVER
jgi:pSer/pThr/pTyr-binding forkhead associated (FHA) protein